jgi:hypothetical protein
MSSLNCLQRSRHVHSGKRQRNFTTRPTRALVVCSAADSTVNTASRRELLANGLMAANVAFLGQLAAPAYAEEDVSAAAAADQPAVEAAVAEVSSSTSVATASGSKQASPQRSHQTCGPSIVSVYHWPLLQGVVCSSSLPVQISVEPCNIPLRPLAAAVTRYICTSISPNPSMFLSRSLHAVRRHKPSAASM